MATVLYIHGFLSSPLSYKAQQTQQWLKVHRPDIHYQCPQLTPYPNECFSILDQIIRNNDSETYMIGSSMGGFWAHVFAERYRLKAVLVNPAVEALTLMPAYTHQCLKSYHSETTYHLNDEHIEQLKHYDTTTVSDKNSLWLMVQTGDETLDYRAAVTRYQDCKQTIEQGGNHSFEGFENHLPDIIHFFEHNKSNL